MRLSTGEVTELPFSDEVSEIVWVGPTNTSVLYINGTNEEIPGGITLYTADLANSPIKPYGQVHSHERYMDDEVDVNAAPS